MALGRDPKLSFTVLKAAEVPQSSCPRWAVLGRSNVGKSSLLNSFVHPRKFFKTGNMPGVTVGLIAVQLYLAKTDKSKLEIIDLPGFGFASRSTFVKAGWQNLANALREKSEAHGLHWIWLADPQRIPEEEEEGLLSWLEGQPFSLVFTKADRHKKNTRAASEKAWARVIRMSSEGPFWVSSLKGEGLDPLTKSARTFVQLQMELNKADDAK